MKRVRHILVIGGTGRKSGKTSVAIKLIKRFSASGIISVKITPHPHPDKTCLLPVIEKESFSIYEENNRGSGKDTSMMLNAGAEHVYLIIAREQYLKAAFGTLLGYLPKNRPVICESPAFRRFFIPDLFIVMKSDDNAITGSKDITDILPYADMVMKLEEFTAQVEESISLDRDNCWYICNL